MLGYPTNGWDEFTVKICQAKMLFVRSPGHETRGRAVHPPQNRTGPTRTDAVKLVKMIVGEDLFEESLF